MESLGVRLPSGVALPGEGARLVGFDLAEDHENWARIRRLLDGWAVPDGIVRTEFSDIEVAAAEWLEVNAWHHGYPQPDDDFGYLSATYDLSDWCEKCGMGKTQKEPFRMKGEPRWGRHDALQLLWVFDELFVKPEVWRAVFEPLGVRWRPVDNRAGQRLKTVVQLQIEEVVPIDAQGRCQKRNSTSVAEDRLSTAC